MGKLAYPLLLKNTVCHNAGKTSARLWPRSTKRWVAERDHRMLRLGLNADGLMETLFGHALQFDRLPRVRLPMPHWFQMSGWAAQGHE